MKTKRNFIISGSFLLAFVVWTALIRFIDVKAIGPNGSCVGFAWLNELVHNLTGANMWLYNVTDWLGLVPLAVVFVFGVLGLVQLIKRKSFAKVDFNILVLGGFYIVVLAVFFLFEVLVINYRPVLIEGVLEASYPSSTTMLVMTVMPTALMQIKARVKSEILRKVLCVGIIVFVAFMVIGRLISGVHWVTDIIGGALFSTGIVMLYHSIVSLAKKDKPE